MVYLNLVLQGPYLPQLLGSLSVNRMSLSLKLPMPKTAGQRREESHVVCNSGSRHTR